jgi:hypothetical protein
VEALILSKTTGMVLGGWQGAVVGKARRDTETQPNALVDNLGNICGIISGVGSV